MAGQDRDHVQMNPSDHMTSHVQQGGRKVLSYLRWLKQLPTFQDVNYYGSLQPVYIS